MARATACVFSTTIFTSTDARRLPTIARIRRGRLYLSATLRQRRMSLHVEWSSESSELATMFIELQGPGSGALAVKMSWSDAAGHKLPD
ncbi:hypothetical protein PENSPDRAFT_230222 [Peniophora sp. CONT]|nr:hypothetical protein PENSPDRAFT_230222 [Peniophora sp. CONT]